MQRSPSNHSYGQSVTFSRGIGPRLHLGFSCQLLDHEPKGRPPTHTSTKSTRLPFEHTRVAVAHPVYSHSLGTTVLLIHHRASNLVTYSVSCVRLLIFYLSVPVAGLSLITMPCRPFSYCLFEGLAKILLLTHPHSVGLVLSLGHHSFSCLGEAKKQPRIKISKSTAKATCACI